MGTRSLIAIKKDNEYKLAQYCQFDGYPSYMGRNILEFLCSHNIEKLKQGVDHLIMISPETVKQYWKDIGVEGTFTDMQTSNKFYKLHPTLSREMGYKILDCIYNSNEPVETLDDLDFAKDGLFCEWGYVIDFDENTFEVYKGKNEELTKKDRFYFDGYCKDGYYPIKIEKSYSLTNLPYVDDFLKDLDEE